MGLDNLKDFLHNIELYQETAKGRRGKRPTVALRKYNVTKLHPVDIDLLWRLYGDLCRTGQSMTSWETIKDICDQCGLTVEPWDPVSWVVKEERWTKSNKQSSD